MNITCPHCKANYLLADAIDKDILDKFKREVNQAQQGEVEAEKKKLKEQMLEFIETQNAKQKAADEKMKNDAIVMQQQMKLQLQADMQQQLQFLQQENQKKDAKIKESQAKELEMLQLHQQLKDVKDNAAFEQQKALLQQEKVVKEQYEREVLPKAIEANMMAMKEKDTQLESLKKTIEQLKQKSEQGSMQLQGEAQELLLEELLRLAFPYDEIDEVSKGVKGADCIQIIRSATGTTCGSIIYESKRTKNWDNEWIDKLKNDTRNAQADVAVIVTQTMPKDIKVFGQKDGVWICSFAHATALASVLRSGIMKVAETKKSEENKGDKMVMLYDFLTSNEFVSHVEAIAEGFTAMRDSITRERVQMEKLWKEREKQIDKVLLNTVGMYGSIKGIAGGSMAPIKLLDGGLEEQE
jgi:hypothetical protein